MKMVLCNVTEWLQDGKVHVHISQCNLTATKMTTMSTKDLDDEDGGAMRFTVAVVLVYGIAAIGVLALGFFSSRKRHKALMDKEAGRFVKTYENVRKDFEKKTRVNAVTSLLQTIHGASTEVHPHASNSMFRSLAFLALPLSHITEEGVIETNNVENVGELEETSLNYPINDQIEEHGGLVLTIDTVNKHSEQTIETSNRNTVKYSAKESPHKLHVLDLENSDITAYDGLVNETESLLNGNKRILTNNVRDSDEISHPDLVIHGGDHETVTLDDEVFETDDDKSIDMCIYSPRDHSPDWVDISDTKFFTV